MAKTPETYDKVADTFEKKGNSAWSDAKSGNPSSYAAAKSFYATSEKAKEKAEELRGKK